MTVNGLDASDVAEKLRGRVKFFPVGDPDRNLLVKSYTVIETFLDGFESSLTAESVQGWLQDQGVKLTKAQLTKLGLDG